MREIDGIEYYPSRLRWHVEQTLRGLYGAVLRDMRALPVVDEAELSALESTYGFLSQYYEQGAEDPERARIMRGIGTSLMRLLRANAAYIEGQELPWNSRSATIQTLRAYGHGEGALVPFIGVLRNEVEPFSQEYFDKLDQLFGLIWTSIDLSEAEEQALHSLLLVEESSQMVAQTIVGALFLGTMQYFDVRKMELLFALWQQHASVMVQGAALSALLILGKRHKEELLCLHPQFVEQVQIALVADEKQLMEALKVIQIAYKTTDNHKIFREKILPELRSISDKLQQVMGHSLTERIEELQNGSIDREKLEEVESLMAKAPDKFSMLKDTEQDVAYHMISELKAFPFFSKISHWFMPFDEHFPGLSKDNVAAFKKLLPMMLQGQRMISSDLYSYALVPTWEQIGSAMLSQMEGQMPSGSPTEITFVDGVKDFVFGAYRFYQLSSHANTLINPFDHSPEMISGAFLSSRCTLSEEGLLSLASIMVRFGQYAEAGHTYERVVHDYRTNTAEVWRGMAVASMMRNDDEQALEQLRRAVELEGKSEVTVRKIAQILIRLGRKVEAVEWITTGEGELGEGIGYQLPLQRATLLYELGRTEEALKAAYKADYVADGKNLQSTLLLLELLLSLGKVEEAGRRLEGKELKGELLLWAGLVSIALGHRVEGLSQLRKWQEEGSLGAELGEKLSLLEHYGIEPWEEALIEDIIYRQVQ
ncbi:tetratricopeptide repeat protein [Porphyromonas levii]|uniref:tetratricopeptide repeat protein n=1 Tax=Porphyromonas levii TaxID=28114 RepID=UPI001B8AE85D|nr:tetratricopeptide repeat protein [Porphyromonas levii]MBR8768962.1 hypothetical protein [Porphyromonas levii]